ncbi:MAG TPA: hypothetical protein VHD62_17885 [Opitutaceae bacterium]|nr:hypothetical protein [Opitutaceae bacterium]
MSKPPGVERHTSPRVRGVCAKLPKARDQKGGVGFAALGGE